MGLAYRMVDVFGTHRFDGNPLAVVFDDCELGTESMLAVTRWINLSETVFVSEPSQPGADYRARIFTLAGELPFAGHPTLGACHAWLEARGRSAGRSGVDTAASQRTEPETGGERVVQECGAGLIEVRRSGGRLAFAAPPLVRDGPVSSEDLATALAVLGLGEHQVVEARWVDNGPGWMGVLLPHAEAVLGIEPDVGPHAGSLDLGVVGPWTDTEVDAAYEVRAFFPDGNGRLLEDPVTGSLNASIAQWMLDTGRAAAPYVARQGTRLGRAGRVFVDRGADGTIWVGGATRTIVEGEITI